MFSNFAAIHKRRKTIKRERISVYCEDTLIGKENQCHFKHILLPVTEKKREQMQLRSNLFPT